MVVTKRKTKLTILMH